MWLNSHSKISSFKHSPGMKAVGPSVKGVLLEYTFNTSSVRVTKKLNDVFPHSTFLWVRCQSHFLKHSTQARFLNFSPNRDHNCQRFSSLLSGKLTLVNSSAHPREQKILGFYSPLLQLPLTLNQFNGREKSFHSNGPHINRRISHHNYTIYTYM